MIASGASESSLSQSMSPFCLIFDEGASVSLLLESEIQITFFGVDFFGVLPFLGVLDFLETAALKLSLVCPLIGPLSFFLLPLSSLSFLLFDSFPEDSRLRFLAMAAMLASADAVASSKAFLVAS